jgi:uncharacterized protein (DUF2147 family)
MRRLAALAIAAAAAVSAGAAAAQPAPADTFGVWRNPKDNVRIEIRPCGDGACGTVIWATPRVQAKAREAGTPNMIGLQIFRELELDRNGVWRGKVFVPDLGRTFSGSAQPMDNSRLRAKGCIIGGVLCKSQVWTKVA